MSIMEGFTADVPDVRNPNGYYSGPRMCFYCLATFEGRNEFWNHVEDEHPDLHYGDSRRPADEDRAGGRNTLTRRAPADAAS